MEKANVSLADMRGENDMGSSLIGDRERCVTTTAAVPCPKYVQDMLVKAESLLSFAAESGIPVEDRIREQILSARQASNHGNINKSEADAVLTALTTLAIKVRPVTLESLEWHGKKEEARKTIRFLGIIAIVTGCIIVAISVCTFMSKQLAQKIVADIETANALVSKLRAELGPAPATSNTADGNETTNISSASVSADQIWWGTQQPPTGISDRDVISDLQQFAATMREIEGYSRLLNSFIFNTASDPLKTNPSPQGRRRLELTPGLAVRLSQELSDRTEEYQEVRSFAKKVQEQVAVYYGAIATALLPVLYALLGAGAFLLRSHEAQIKTKTFTGRDRHVDRFLMAGIAGLVIGLFSDFTQGITVSPFALAFLVGYAADVFFSFLEGLINAFKRAPASPEQQTQSKDRAASS